MPNHPHLPNLTAILSALATFYAFAPTGLAAESAPLPEQVLERLVGSWKVTGTIRGQAISQTLTAKRILARRFVQLHFKGLKPMGKGEPPYEARVVMGWDPKAKRFVGHWMDVFGAGASEPVGHGQLQGQALVMVYPYPSSHFRNTFRFDSKARQWRLLIEARKPDNTWATFAEQRFSRVGR